MNTKHIRHILRSILLMSAVLLLFSACGNGLLGTTGNLSITAINKSARTLAPQDCAAVSYHATGIGPSEITLDQTQATPAFTFDSLAVGAWTIQIDGLDAEGNVLLSGLATVDIVSGQTTTESIVLVPAAGNGTVDLAVSWPADKSVTGVYASLVSVADSQISQSLDFTINQSTALCTSSTVASGSWILTITLDCGPGTSPIAITEGVQIYKGKATSGTFQLAAEDFCQGYTVTYMDTGSEGGTAPVDRSAYPLDGTGVARTKGTLGSLTRPGYILSGWNTRADGSGTDYASGNPVPVPGNLVLYPVWLDETVLTVDNNGIVTDCSDSYTGKLILPEGVTSIGDYAFQNCSLVSISIPEGVISIGTCAFYGCSSLSGISLPEGLASIGGYAFSGCSSLSSISLPEGLTGIGSGFFSNCNSITSIRIPEGVSRISDSAFSGCSSLSSISLPVGLASIGVGAFSGCSSLATISLPDNVTYIGDSAFLGCSSLSSISLPAGITGIGNFTFQDCSSLANISIPEGVPIIGYGAFSGCSSLASISLPEGLTNIYVSVFYGCTSLANINLPAGITSIGSGAFHACSNLVSINLPAGITSIGAEAFYGCSSLASISLPTGITSIDRSVFDGCSSLASISIPEGVTSIGYSAFYDCSSLATISFPQGITSIGGSAFYGCSSLASISLPDSVTSIDNWAFYDCSNLTEVLMNPVTPPQLYSNSLLFYGASADLQIKVPAGSVDAYKAATGWSAYASNIVSQ